MSTYGYARVSTRNQSLSPQRIALNGAGADEVFCEKISGTFRQRPVLDELLGRLCERDTLLVVRLDRLGRSLPHLVATVEELSARGVIVRSLHEDIDTGSANGRLMLGLFAALAQFERDLISERTKAGLVAARAAGKTVGRPVVMSAAKLEAARVMQAEGVSYQKIADALGISRATVVRHLRGANW